MTIATGQRTLAELRLEARQRADRVLPGAGLNDPVDPYAGEFVTSAELNSLLNASFKGLYGTIVTAYGNGYAVSRWTFTTNGSTDEYPLARDLFKLLGIDWKQTPGDPSTNVTLQPFNLGERNRFSRQGFAAAAPWGHAVPRYRLSGDRVWLNPRPDAGLQYEVIYVPRVQPLVDRGFIRCAAVQAGDAVTINAVTLTAVAHGTTPNANEFVIGGGGTTNRGDAGTAQSLTDAINASALGAPVGIFSAGLDSTNTVAVALQEAATVTWSVSDGASGRLILSPRTVTGPEGNVITWSNVMTGYNGWEDYVIVDAAIRMLKKEESDFKGLELERQGLKQRIEMECENRDEGGVATVTDVYRRGGDYGDGGPGYGGGFV